VNSALQRARKAVDERVPATSQRAELDALGSDGRRELVDAFVTAWGARRPRLLGTHTWEDSDNVLVRYATTA
jgi:hypothetical protein